MMMEKVLITNNLATKGHLTVTDGSGAQQMMMSGGDRPLVAEIITMAVEMATEIEMATETRDNMEAIIMQAEIEIMVIIIVREELPGE